MEKQPKTYKTELIIAIITGLTGIIVAAMSNWDKISKPNVVTKNDTVRIYTSPNNPGSSDIFFKDYHLFTQAADYADKMARQGWEIESLRYSKTDANTEDYVSLESERESLIKGHTYQIILFNSDPKKEFTIRLYPIDTTQKIDTILTTVELKVEFSLEKDIKAISFQIPEEKIETRYAYLIISKKS